jgi:phage tail protein X
MTRRTTRSELALFHRLEMLHGTKWRMSAAEERWLIHRAQHDVPWALQQLIRCELMRVARAVVRHCPHEQDYDDAAQDAIVALIRTIRRCDVDGTTRLAQRASWPIREAVERGQTRAGGQPPSRIAAAQRRLDVARQRAWTESGRMPSTLVLAAEHGIASWEVTLIEGMAIEVSVDDIAAVSDARTAKLLVAHRDSPSTVPPAEPLKSRHGPIPATALSFEDAATQLGIAVSTVGQYASTGVLTRVPGLRAVTRDSVEQRAMRLHSRTARPIQRPPAVRAPMVVEQPPTFAQLDAMSDAEAMWEYARQSRRAA